MDTRDAPTFEFADSSHVRHGQKHRRGRGYAANNRKVPSAALQSSSHAGAQSQTMMHHQQAQSQANYYTTDAWDDADAHHRKDDNTCTGSLTYSACSSEASEASEDNADSANKTSFSDIIKLIESEVEGEFSIAASGSGGDDFSSGGRNRGSGSAKETAVAGWMQRVDYRSMMQHKEQQTKAKKQSSTAATAIDDDRDEDGVFDVDFDDNVLETIAGHDDDSQDPFTSFASPRRRPSRHVTPPPNSRHERTSTSPLGANSVSRTNSRHSKSSSDGSWETPPSSPPNISATMMKPPHARSTPVSKSRHTSGRGDEKNEAFYAKPWMSGFSDAFNFDGFDKDEAFDFDGFRFHK